MSGVSKGVEGDVMGIRGQGGRQGYPGGSRGCTGVPGGRRDTSIWVLTSFVFLTSFRFMSSFAFLNFFVGLTSLDFELFWCLMLFVLCCCLTSLVLCTL